ncbi:MAG: DUF4351 domain-containing protein [Candidatus Viridilinea halotolerans]|uniref:DUF4351 domain-containing protein n=1 Tax=Candidatus Viridilinea halotolerans TaxID=2491704 RepID=A0A426TSN3_9CHLR|nr:MAG: DUF4351 domain-containing protein [Candidatus Viridilinea halotolerans]
MVRRWGRSGRYGCTSTHQWQGPSKSLLAVSRHPPVGTGWRGALGVEPSGAGGADWSDTTLLIELLTLCTDKEVAAMAEQIVQYDSYGMEESPFILKWIAKGREEERQTLLLRLLTRRYGSLSSDMMAQVNALTATQMLDLAEALLDFTSYDALAQWLAEQAKGGDGEEV